MVVAYRLAKEKQYPQPHDLSTQMVLGCDYATPSNTTIIPCIAHDEALLPSSRYTNPEHASFVEEDAANCSADSKIFKIQCDLRISLTKDAVGTDNIQALRLAFMTIHGAFEDFDAKDELTTVTVGDVLELTKETTDRQTYPIYNDTKINEKYSGSATLDAKAMGLTATQVIEHVAFDPDLYYDALNYYTISDKLKKVQDGLRWITLTQQNPTRLLRFNIKTNVKSMNPYAFMGILLHLPVSGSKYQIPLAGETTGVNHIHSEFRCRYLEWNDNFNHERA